MATQRIQIVRDGDVRPVTPNDPLLTINRGLFGGFMLEQHRLPAGELRAAFVNHLLGVNIGGPYWEEWHTEGRRGRVLVPPGGVSTLCSGQEVWCSWDRPRTCIALAIEPETMQTVAYEAVGHKVELMSAPNVVDKVVETFVTAIHSEILSGCPGGQLFRESLANDLAGYLLRQYAVRTVKLRRLRGGIPLSRLRRVIDYIEASLARELRITEIAGVAEMSPYYFGKLFKQSIGITVHQYVTKRRIQRAICLLGQNHVATGDVGAAIGVPNQSQFTRLFHQHVGTTPGRYRTISSGIL